MTPLPLPQLSRRALIGGAGALALPSLASPARARPGGPMPPVKVDSSRIIREVVGLRPFRPSGFVVRAEEAPGGKLIVHNYGHGGGGITLSWGSSRLAVDLALARRHRGPAAVIGAGVMGLTTARLLQEAGYQVTIYADKLPPETTSNIAGGQWHPAFVFDKDRMTPEFGLQLTQAARYAYRRFQSLIGDDYGVRWMRNHALGRTPIEEDPVDSYLPGMLPEMRDLGQYEHPFPFQYVRQWDGPMVETPRFLRAMLRDVQIAGARIVIRWFKNQGEVRGLSEPLVFNCTGLGARDLFGDEELIPVRGQLMLMLPQPEVTYAINYDGDVEKHPVYMFSRSDAIILGGTSQRGDWNTEVVPADSEIIYRQHKAIFDHFRAT